MKLSKTLFKRFAFIATVSIILTAVFSTVAFWFVFTAQEEQDLKSYAQTVAHFYNIDTDNVKYEDYNLADSRITLINPKGEVLFDSQADTDSAQNHSDRPEFRQAIESGEGKSNRMSSTLKSTTFYYAVRTDDGNVLRASKTIGSVVEIFANVLPLVLVAIALVITVCLLMSRRATKKIIEPIELMARNLDYTSYDELIPLAEKISSQQKEIKKQVKRLQIEKDKINTLIQNMSEGFILIDMDKQVLMSNHSAARLVGRDTSAVIGKDFFSFARNDVIKECVESALKGTAKSGDMTINGRVLQIITNPVCSNGKQNGVICMIIDVSAKKKAEKMRREFTANVTHELKTPLTSISGYAEIISSGFARPDDVQGFARKIHKESGRLLTLIGDIIELSQLDEGTSGEDFVPVELSGIATEVADDLRSHAEKNGVKIYVDAEKSMIRGNRNQLYELIYNLCDNAIRYNRPNGEVKISVKNEGESAPVVRVSDTGIGIPEKYRKRVFERFFRVDKSRSKETGGTGLGLAIVKHIAELHGGTVDLESGDNGTTFIVTF